MAFNIGLLIIVLFLILVLIGVPIYIALIAPSLLYLILMGEELTIAAIRMTRATTSFTILVVPLFIFVGTLMNHCGISKKIFTFSNNLVGHVRGGTAEVNVIASLIFSGVSGSALADIGGIGQILINQMNREGYDSAYSSALTSASATIGPIFPPSVPLVIFGVLAEVSVIDLLLAGVLPALCLTVMLGLAVLIHARIADFPVGERPTASAAVRSFIIAFPALLTPVILISGMLAGLFGPTEAAGVTVVWIFGITIFAYREYEDFLSNVWKASVEASVITARVMLIVIGAVLFQWVLTIERTPDALAEILLQLSGNMILLLIVINIFLLILGLFLEPLSAMVISIPLVVPPLVEVGLDPVHIGVIMVFNLMIGLVTPPLGLSVFITSDISGVPVADVVSELKPYYVILVLTLLLITFVPELSLWLPDQVR